MPTRTKTTRTRTTRPRPSSPPAGPIPPKLVAYYRVSTRKQGESGLGLDGQVAAVDAYAKTTGAEVIRAYREVESGKRADRPELLKVIAHAKRSGARLVIAKLDRLARNVAFLANLMDSGVDFVACDNPHANRLTIHILAAVAEDEARRTSERTRDALAAYKARGGLLGAARPGARTLSPEDSQRGRERAEQVRQERARTAYADLVPMMAALRAEGRSLREIADRLNTEGHTTRRGQPWNQTQVKRVLERGGPIPAHHLEGDLLPGGVIETMMAIGASAHQMRTQVVRRV